MGDKVADEVAEKRNEEGFHNEQTGRNLMRKDKRSAFQLIIRNFYQPLSDCPQPDTV